jgi:cytochrome b561
MVFIQSNKSLFNITNTSMLILQPENLFSHYSYRKAAAGFLVAALQLCRLIMRIARPNTLIPARTNTHQVRLDL